MYFLFYKGIGVNITGLWFLLETGIIIGYRPRRWEFLKDSIHNRGR